MGVLLLLLRFGRSDAEYRALRGDLEEEYRRLSRSTAAHARWWLMRQVVVAIAHALRDIVRPTIGLDPLRQDVAYGWRQVARHRGSSLLAIGTLALGIGASTVVFSVVDATMLRPLPYPHPEQLVQLRPSSTFKGAAELLIPSQSDVDAWRSRPDLFALVAASGNAPYGLIAHGSQPERLRTMLISEHFLALHGVHPVRGRDFTAADAAHNAPVVALLGHDYWQRRYQGSDLVIGDVLQLNIGIATIVGVMPPGFHADVPLVLPLRVRPDEYSVRGFSPVNRAYARLQPGVSVEAAEKAVNARSGAAGDERTVITSRLEDLAAGSRTTVRAIGAAVGLILLLACVNVAGLLQARGHARQSEIVVRTALGAGRLRLIRQLVTESVVLAAPGGVLGVCGAWLMLDMLVAALPLTFPANVPVSLNPGVLLATSGLLLVTAVIAGLAPATGLTRSSLRVMRSGSRHVASHRSGRMLITAETAVAVILVVGAGLMLRSYARITQVDLGFTPAGIVTMEVLPLDTDSARRGVYDVYFDDLLNRLRAAPGVMAAGMSGARQGVLSGSGGFGSVSVNGASTATQNFTITPGYLEALGARLVRGRFPTQSDFSLGAGNVVINDTASRLLFPDQSAIGRTIMRSGRQWTVIGVVRDVWHDGPVEGPSRYPAQAYFPFAAAASPAAALVIVVRQEPAASLQPRELQQVAESIGPRVLVERIRTGDELFDANVVTPWRRTLLLSVLGAMGTALALVGVAGVATFAVTRRTGEIGVRLAIGARPDQVVGAMMRSAATPIIVGALVGAAGAVFASRVIEGFLFETSPTDAATIVTVVAIVTGTACLAALIPSLRASRIDPVICLRHE